MDREKTFTIIIQLEIIYIESSQEETKTKEQGTKSTFEKAKRMICTGGDTASILLLLKELWEVVNALV